MKAQVRRHLPADEGALNALIEGRFIPRSENTLHCGRERVSEISADLRPDQRIELPGIVAIESLRLRQILPHPQVVALRMAKTERAEAGKAPAIYLRCRIGSQRAV